MDIAIRKNSHHSYAHNMQTTRSVPFHQNGPKKSCFSPIFPHFFSFFLCSHSHFNGAQRKHIWYAIGNICEKHKKRILFYNIIFLRIKMDILFMSFLEKKDRILKLFYPVVFSISPKRASRPHFHFTGLGLNNLNNCIKKIIIYYNSYNIKYNNAAP